MEKTPEVWKQKREAHAKYGISRHRGLKPEEGCSIKQLGKLARR